MVNYCVPLLAGMRQISSTCQQQTCSEKISLLLTRKDGFTEIIANITLNKINMLNEKIVHTNRHRTAKYCRYRECQRYVQYQKKIHAY